MNLQWVLSICENKSIFELVVGVVLKLLWIARTCPYPTNDGEKLRVFNILKALSKQHYITLVYREIDDDERGAVNVLGKICRGGVFAIKIPRPQGALDRIKWVLPFLFSKYPVSLCTVYFKQIRDVVFHLVDTREFDVVQVEHSSLSIYLDYVQLAGATRTVLTMHNIDYVRNERVLQNTPFGLMWCFHWLNQRRFKQWEIASIRRFDQIVAMSDLDRQTMLGDEPGLEISVVPNGVDVEAVTYHEPLQDNRDVIFVASMDSEANHDGAMFFHQEVWPKIKDSCANSRLIFVGRAPRNELLALDDGHRVLVTGKVEDVLPYYRRAAVAVVPLRSGGGTRLKILEAMAIGTPVVSTTVGCEGLEVSDQHDILIADLPDAMAAAVLELLKNIDLRRSLSRSARLRVEQSYDWRNIARMQDAVYAEAIGDSR